MSKIIFAEDGWDDYLYWQTQDRKKLQKINKLLKSKVSDDKITVKACRGHYDD